MGNTFVRVAPGNSTDRAGSSAEGNGPGPPSLSIGNNNCKEVPSMDQQERRTGRDRREAFSAEMGTTVADVGFKADEDVPRSPNNWQPNTGHVINIGESDVPRRGVVKAATASMKLAPTQPSASTHVNTNDTNHLQNDDLERRWPRSLWGLARGWRQQPLDKLTRSLSALQNQQSNASSAAPMALGLVFGDISGARCGIRVHPERLSNASGMRWLWKGWCQFLKAVHAPPGAGGWMVQRGRPILDGAFYIWDVVSDAVLAKNLLSNGYNRLGGLVLLFMLWHYFPTYLLILNAANQAFFLQRSSLPASTVRAGLGDHAAASGNNEVSAGALLGIITMVLDLSHMLLYTLLVIFGLPLIPLIDVYMVLSALVLPASKAGHVMRTAENICRHYERIRLPLECFMESFPQTGLQVYLYIQTKKTIYSADTGATGAVLQVSQTVLLTSLLGSVLNLLNVSWELYFSYRASGCTVKEYLWALISLQGYTRVPMEVETALLVRVKEQQEGIDDHYQKATGRVAASDSQPRQQAGILTGLISADFKGTIGTNSGENMDPPSDAHQFTTTAELLSILRYGSLPKKLILRIGGPDDALYQALSVLPRQTLMDYLGKTVPLHTLRAVTLRQLEPASVSRLFKAASSLPGYLRLEGDWRSNQKVGASAISSTYTLPGSYVDVVTKTLPETMYELYSNSGDMKPLLDLHLSRLKLTMADSKQTSTQFQKVHHDDSKAIGKGLAHVLRLQPHLTWLLVDRCDIDAGAMLFGLYNELHQLSKLSTAVQTLTCSSFQQQGDNDEGTPSLIAASNPTESNKCIASVGTTELGKLGAAGPTADAAALGHPHLTHEPRCTLVVVHAHNLHDKKLSEDILSQRIASDNVLAPARELHLIPGFILNPEMPSADAKVIMAPYPRNPALLDILTPLLSTVMAPEALNRGDYGQVFDNLTDEDFAAIGSCLILNTSVKTLNLCKTGLVKDNIRLLLWGVKAHTSLTSIDLSYNEIGDYGARCVAEAMAALPQLRSLELGACGFGADGANALAGHILVTGVHSRLVSLALHNNPAIGTALMEWICFMYTKKHKDMQTAKCLPQNHLQGHEKIPAFGLAHKFQSSCLSMLAGSQVENKFTTADESLSSDYEPRFKDRTRHDQSEADIIDDYLQSPPSRRAGQLKCLKVSVCEHISNQQQFVEYLVLACITVASTAFPAELEVDGLLKANRTNRRPLLFPWMKADSDSDSDSDSGSSSDGRLVEGANFSLPVLITGITGSLLSLNWKQLQILKLANVNLVVQSSSQQIRQGLSLELLCKGLTCNTTLKVLSLFKCHLDDEAVKTLCKELQQAKDSCLERLELHGNENILDDGILFGIVPLLQKIASSHQQEHICPVVSEQTGQLRSRQHTFTVTISACVNASSTSQPGHITTDTCQRLLQYASSGWGDKMNSIPTCVNLCIITTSNTGLDRWIESMEAMSIRCKPSLVHNGSFRKACSADRSHELQVTHLRLASDTEAIALSLCLAQCVPRMNSLNGFVFKELDVRCSVGRILSTFAAECIIRALMISSVSKAASMQCWAAVPLLRLGPVQPSILLMQLLKNLCMPRESDEQQLDMKSTGNEIQEEGEQQSRSHRGDMVEYHTQAPRVCVWKCQLAAGDPNIDKLCTSLQTYIGLQEQDRSLLPVCPGVSLKNMSPHHIMALAWVLVDSQIAADTTELEDSLTHHNKCGRLQNLHTQIDMLFNGLTAKYIGAASNGSAVAHWHAEDGTAHVDASLEVLIEACRFFISGGVVMDGAEEHAHDCGASEPLFTQADAAAFVLAIMPGDIGLEHQLDFGGSALSHTGLSLLLRLLPFHKLTLQQLSLADQSCFSPDMVPRSSLSLVVKLQRQFCLEVLPSLATTQLPAGQQQTSSTSTGSSSSVSAIDESASGKGLLHLNVSGCGFPTERLATALKGHKHLETIWVGRRQEAIQLQTFVPGHIMVKSLPASNSRVDLSKREASSTEKELIELCRHGDDLDKLYSFLEDPAINPNANEDGVTALHAAIQSGNLAFVELLIHAGADVKLSREESWWPSVRCDECQNNAGLRGKRYKCRECSNYDMCSSCYVEGCKHEPGHVLYLSEPSEDQITETSLYLAAAAGNPDIVGLLIEKGAPLGTAGDDKTPLHLACKNGLTDIVSKLLQAGADIGATTAEEGRTPLHEACWYGHADVVSLLLEAFDEADSSVLTLDAKEKVAGRTALHLACRNNHVDVVKLMIAAKASIEECEGAYDDTPLLLAARKNQPEALQVLIDGNANLEARNRDNETALQLASKLGYVNIVNILLAKGANVNGGKPENSETPLHLACRAGHVQVVELLLNARADVHATSESGTTPLQYACANDNGGKAVDIVRLLLKKNADVNTRNKRKGWTALHYACQEGSCDTIKVLLEHGANTTVQSNDGKTPPQMVVQGRQMSAKILALFKDADN